MARGHPERRHRQPGRRRRQGERHPGRPPHLPRSQGARCAHGSGHRGGHPRGCRLHRGDGGRGAGQGYGRPQLPRRPPAPRDRRQGGAQGALAAQDHRRFGSSSCRCELGQHLPERWVGERAQPGVDAGEDRGLHRDER